MMLRIEPPSTPHTAEVTKDARSDARKTTTLATSSGSPRRPSGNCLRLISCSTASFGGMLWNLPIVSAKPPGFDQNGVQIGYSIPKEGALMWFDSFVVPKDAANVDAALKFIDFVNKPEMAAKNSDFIQYANGNIASKPLLSAALRDNPGVYPPDEVMGRLYTITPYDQKSQRLVNRLWTRIKTGK